MQQTIATQQTASRGRGLAKGSALRTDRREPARLSGRALGLFSLGLGLAEVLAPSQLANLIGVPNNPRTRFMLRAFGVRELLAAAGLLGRPVSSGWLWNRVAGDAMDLAFLLNRTGSRRARTGRVLAATAAVAGVTVLDALTAAKLSRNSTLSQAFEPIHVQRSITINQPRDVVYEYWRDLTNLPRFMEHLESVDVENGHSTWTAKGPAGISISWKAEIVLDRTNECIAWRSVEGTTSVPNRGVVRFEAAPGGRGTEVHVELKYDPPGGAVGAAFAKLFGEEPSMQIKSDLRRLKQVLETGEVVHSDASIHSGPHPGRPIADLKQAKGKQVAR